MKKLKIGLFMDDFYPSINGVISVVDNYARRLSKYANVVVVVPSTDKDYIDNTPYRVVRIKSYKLPTLDYYVGRPISIIEERKLIKEKFDLIHIHTPFTVGDLGLRVGKALNIPVIATMHTQYYLDFKRHTKSDTVSKTLLKIIMRVFNDCYRCYAVNENVAKIYLEYGAKEKPGVLLNGTELKLITNGMTTDKEINKKYGFDKDDIVLLFLGRINILKNILFVLDVAHNLKQRGFKFKLMFVGTLEDGDTLLKRVLELNLDDDVIITGKIMDRLLISKIYHRANLFVFPSLYDASSIVQIEAASQKTPTIFIEGATTACSVIDNVNGFLAPSDPIMFADRIIKIFNDKKLYEEVCEGAYKDLYKHWDEIIRNLLLLYQNTIKEYHKKFVK